MKTLMTRVPAKSLAPGDIIRTYAGGAKLLVIAVKSAAGRTALSFYRLENDQPFEASFGDEALIEVNATTKD
jgi:hypothetical protein